jgi:DNA replication protein DnaC
VSSFATPGVGGAPHIIMACEICNGTGWKLVDVDARASVVRCECWRETLVERLTAEARIPRRYHHCHLDRFETYGNESLQNALTLARSLVERFPVVSKGLFLIGQPGVGKTHLAVAILRQLIEEKGARGVFYDTRDLLRVIRSTYGPESGSRASESDVLRPVIEADLFVLDDLGAEKTSEWVDETLNYIVNSRYSERRLTIFTSNYDYSENGDWTDPDSLPVRVGLRMFSRLHEMCEIHKLEGADYRELPLNGSAGDLRALWKVRQERTRGLRGAAPRASLGRQLPSRTSGQARVRPGDESTDLKWSGGRAGN